MENKTAVTALAALAQETRLAIFHGLAQAGAEGLAAGKLSETLGITPFSLSFHPKKLVYFGLISSRNESRFNDLFGQFCFAVAHK
ncbi:MAG TPA: helix-turn-helix domain-containing protein [Methylobacter sp.]|jgi:DNA-binding transcriptional ArsR family regulator